MKENTLISLLLSRAEALAAEYGCGLDRLDPDELAYYTDRVTEANLDVMAGKLAAAAWQAY